MAKIRVVQVSNGEIVDDKGRLWARLLNMKEGAYYWELVELPEEPTEEEGI